jgi:nucleoside-diphosphate-sugar epimerase
MKILIFGGGGYLGLSLIKKLDRGNHEIIVFDKFVRTTPDLIKEKVTIINDDICNVDNYVTLFEDLHVLLYLASPRLSDLKTDEQFDIEILNLRKVLSHTQPNTKFFFSSSCSVYGISNYMVNESSNLVVTSLYSKLKIESERIILESDRINSTILRFATLYGRGVIDRDDILINNIVKKVKNKETIEIFDKNSIRPHLHIDDCVEILINLIAIDEIDEKIINIGSTESNISKVDLIEKIEKTLDLKIDVKYFDTRDSRSYIVDFNLLLKYYNQRHTNYERGIFYLYFSENITFSLEDWDTLLDYYRPNGSSKSWYLAEEGKLDIPKMWGVWNIVDTQKDNKLFPFGTIREQITPSFYNDCVEFLSIDKIENKKHIYYMNVFDPVFFIRNASIGFKCISPKYLDDVRRNICKIVICNTLEGYSGSEGNLDLEILNKWIIDSNLPEKNVYYISANLLIDDIRKEKNLNFKCFGISTFDSWLNFIELSKIPFIEFVPDENKYLYLTYNRNPRYHRILLLSKFLQKDLLNLGKISLNRFDLSPGTDEHDIVRKLHELTPIVMDKPLNINWANDMTVEDYIGTFISIVTESLTDKETLFLSEKIWKPLALGHPFMVLGNKGTLKYLKSLGFMTFDKWFDESYDDEPEMNIRAEIIANEIEKYKLKTKEDLINIREQMRDICLHNKNLFLKIVTDKYSFNGDNMNGLKQIQLIIYSIYNDLLNDITIPPKML